MTPIEFEQLAGVSRSDVPCAGSLVDGRRFPFGATLLVIDDEKDTAELLNTSLRGACHIVWARSGAEGLRMAASELPDLVIVDLNLPGMSGQEVCRRLRSRGDSLYLPILVLTGEGDLRGAARVAEETRCLDLGADDFLVKGDSLARLHARVRGLVRRRRFGTDGEGVIRLGAVALESASRRVSVADVISVSLTSVEVVLMATLMGASGRPVDRAFIHKTLYREWPSRDDNRIKKHVSNVRLKLGRFKGLLKAIRSHGYRFNLELAQGLPNCRPRGRVESRALSGLGKVKGT